MKIRLVLSLIIVSILFITGCKNGFNLPDTASGMGTFILNIDGSLPQGRTIMPGEDHNEFTFVRMVFTIADESTVVEGGDFIRPINNTAVSLPVGSYDLTVWVFTGESAPTKDDYDNYTAWGESEEPIKIGEGVTLGSIELQTRETGNGTFSWSITFNVHNPAITGAIMRVWPTTGPGSNTEADKPLFQADLLGAASPNYRIGSNDELPRGQYRIILTLSRDGYRDIVWRDTLRIFPNMESHFEQTFTNQHFLRRIVTVTFNRNFIGADDPWQERSYLAGDSISVEPPADPDKPGHWNFGGWFMSAAAANSLNEDFKWNIDTDVLTGDLPLFAGWIGYSVLSAVPSVISFSSLLINNNIAAPQTVTITNTGTAQGTVNIALSGNNAASFSLSTASLAIDAAPNNTSTFTVQQVLGLGLGTYNAAINITGDGIFTIPVTFSVVNRMVPVPTATAIENWLTGQPNINFADITAYTVNGAPAGSVGEAPDTAVIALSIRIGHSGPALTNEGLSNLLRTAGTGPLREFDTVNVTHTRVFKVPALADIREAVESVTGETTTMPVFTLGVIKGSVGAITITGAAPSTAETGSWAPAGAITGVTIANFNFTGHNRNADVQAAVGSKIRDASFTFADNAVAITSSTPVWLMPMSAIDLQTEVNNRIEEKGIEGLDLDEAYFTFHETDIEITITGNLVTVGGTISMTRQGDEYPDIGKVRNSVRGFVVDELNLHRDVINPLFTEGFVGTPPVGAVAGTVTTTLTIDNRVPIVIFPTPGQGFERPTDTQIEAFMNRVRAGAVASGAIRTFGRRVPLSTGVANDTGEFLNVAPSAANRRNVVGTNDNSVLRTFEDFLSPAFINDIRIDNNGNLTIRVPLGGASRRPLTEMPASGVDLGSAATIRPEGAMGLGWRPLGINMWGNGNANINWNNTWNNRLLPDTADRETRNLTGSARPGGPHAGTQLAYRIYFFRAGTQLVDGVTHQVINLIEYIDYNTTGQVVFRAIYNQSGTANNIAANTAPSGIDHRAISGATAGNQRGDSMPMGAPLMDVLTLYFWPRD